MVYSILITFSLTNLVQTGFIIYLWSRLIYQDKLITYESPPIAYASAPVKLD
jgi:hypothetical protein